LTSKSPLSSKKNKNVPGYIFAIPTAMQGIPSLLSFLYLKDVFSTAR
jgi:hypothetical protein